MKKSSSLLIILFLIILVAAIIIFVIYRDSNKTQTAALSATNIAPTITPQPVFDPASLSWVEATSSAAWEQRDSHAFVVYDNKMWVMGGLDANGHVSSPGNVDYGNAKYFSDVWSSEDGTNWQLVTENAPWGERRSIEVVDFNGKMWLMGGWGPKVGYKNDVWSSTDGSNWKLETASAAWPAREGHQLVVFQNKIWLIGGVRYDKHQLFTDVWYSSDGINWTEATKDAGWAPRWDHASGVFDNKLWTIGGMDFTGQGRVFKDVWSSSDGIKWTLVNASPPFQVRQGNVILEYENKLWLVGRLNIAYQGGGANDVWYSSDGINWQKTKLDPGWTGREDVAVLLFKNRMWVLGGMDSNWSWTNDVWYSTSNLDKK